MENLSYNVLSSMAEMRSLSAEYETEDAEFTLSETLSVTDPNFELLEFDDLVKTIMTELKDPELQWLFYLYAQQATKFDESVSINFKSNGKINHSEMMQLAGFGKARSRYRRKLIELRNALASFGFCPKKFLEPEADRAEYKWAAIETMKCSICEKEIEISRKVEDEDFVCPECAVTQELLRDLGDEVAIKILLGEEI